MNHHALRVNSKGWDDQRWVVKSNEDEEVSLVDGVLEGALGALVYDEEDDVLVMIIWKGFMGRKWFENGMKSTTSTQDEDLIAYKKKEDKEKDRDGHGFRASWEAIGVFVVAEIQRKVQRNFHSKNEDSFTYDSTPNSFDNPPDFSYPPPQPQYVPYSCELCGNDAHHGKFKRFSFYETPKVISLAWETISEIEHAFEDKQYQPRGILELFRKLHDNVKNIHEELAEYINTPNWNRLIIYYDDDDDEDYTIAITPVLSTEDPVDSLIMEDEHLDTIPVTESDEVIKSSVENLVQIPSESEGIPDKMCDVPFRDNSPPLDILKDQFEGFSDSNDDSTSINDDSFSIDDIDYVEASPPDSELVSLKEVKDFHTDDGEIEDDILREKLPKINFLIAKIEEINSNPPPSSDFVTKSSFIFLNFFLEETNTFDNSIPESETFCFDLEEKSSGSTTTHSDISLSKYDSFIFDLSNDLFPPADGSDLYHEEFADELAHIISPPEYDCFYFKSEPDPGELTSIVDFGIREKVSSTTNVNLPFEDDQSSLLAYVVWTFLPFLTYPVTPPYILSCGNEDTVFDPGISVYHSFMPSVSHRSGTFMKFNIYPNHLNESPMEILSSTCSPMDQ
ncbi:hypothetical protein Tco_0256828 [Tanacetum coccineum]